MFRGEEIQATEYVNRERLGSGIGWEEVGIVRSLPQTLPELQASEPLPKLRPSHLRQAVSLLDSSYPVLTHPEPALHWLPAGFLLDCHCGQEV